jgi:hypothetical protein
MMREATFPGGADKREFCNTAKTYDQLGLPEFYA